MTVGPATASASVGKSRGRHAEKALSAAAVRSLGPGFHPDGQGLYLKVDPSGARRWIQRIVIQGKRRDLGLGSPPLVPLAEAREKALSNRKLARAGGDPLDEARRAQSVLTFEQAARKVHEMHAPTWKNAKHAAQVIGTLETYAFPRLGHLKVADVTTADVLAVLTPIWTTKQETARRVRQRIGTVMKWAVAQGWRQDNPAENIAQALPKAERAKAHRKALPYSEVASCIETVRASGAGLSTKLALEFLVLTAARSGEARGALWSEFDLHGADRATNATWNIPAERMKAKKSHSVPLPSRALEILQEAEALSDGSGLVFPGTKQGKALSDMTLSKLVKELGFDADVHGFRTSFRTWAQERTNFPREIAEAALAHGIKDKAEAAYARSNHIEKRRKLMAAWATFLEARSGEVVSLAAKR
jgi:integrase